ncbi:MAG: pantoate--beta-alanine ligase [Candidatus Porifericomitaceae bacterium WSBS_2022_MAG_OTU9]
MNRCKTLASLTRITRSWRRQGQSIAMVPTMGNLHQGHISLLRRARRSCSTVVASIFVNPDQFNDQSDFRAYPRSLRQDLQKLQDAGVDAVFTPDNHTMFPNGMNLQTKVYVPELSEVLCGKCRPGHFTGVTSMVAHLFGMCRPDVAVFGEKDYQQLLLIRRMCLDLRLPVRIIQATTMRCRDGLAMSSRNSLLTAKQRETAPILYASLRQAVSTAYGNDIGRYATIQQQAKAKLKRAGFKVEYLQILEQGKLRAPQGGKQALRIFAAAWLGKVRLIDNLGIAKK